MDQDIKYLLIILLILVGVSAVNNLLITEEKALDIGFCDTSIDCAGFEAGEVCIGYRYRDTECYDPENAEEYRKAEARCNVQAYNLCEDNDLEGTEWADTAEFNNKTCNEWYNDYEEFTLLPCDEMSPSAHKWEDIR